MASTALSPDALVEWGRDWVGRELGIDAAAVDADKPFVLYGMDSIHATMLVGDLEELLGRRLPPTLTWDHPTLTALARHLAPARHLVPAPDAVADAQGEPSAPGTRPH